MTTSQITLLTIIILVAFISYVNFIFDKNPNRRMFYTTILFFVSYFLLVISIVATLEMNKLQKQVKGICPEYEKIENVYKLKQ